jgi:hypothetical protein
MLIAYYIFRVYARIEPKPKINTSLSKKAPQMQVGPAFGA